jgi:5'-3' exonuclease
MGEASRRGLTAAHFHNALASVTAGYGEALAQLDAELQLARAENAAARKSHKDQEEELNAAARMNGNLARREAWLTELVVNARRELLGVIGIDGTPGATLDAAGMRDKLREVVAGMLESMPGDTRVSPP